MWITPGILWIKESRSRALKAIKRVKIKTKESRSRQVDPPSESGCSVCIYVFRKKKLLRNKMIKIVTDEEVHEMDIELIELFAVYLFDKDIVGMTDLIYVVEDRMAGDYFEDEK